MRWWERSHWSINHPMFPDPVNRKAEPDHQVPGGTPPKLGLRGKKEEHRVCPDRTRPILGLADFGSL